MAEKDYWFKDAIFYELHVKAFCDAKGDGTGDFQGLTEKLPYLKELGVDAVPFLFEEEGTSCDNLPKTHAFCKDLRKMIDDRYFNVVLLAEANQ